MPVSDDDIIMGILKKAEWIQPDTWLVLGPIKDSGYQKGEICAFMPGRFPDNMVRIDYILDRETGEICFSFQRNYF